MELSGEKPGPKLGHTLNALLEEVLDEPTRNSAEYMEKRAIELMRLREDELKKLGDAGRIRREEEEKTEIAELQKKHDVCC
jgi:hypothetical protein